MKTKIAIPLIASLCLLAIPVGTIASDPDTASSGSSTQLPVVTVTGTSGSLLSPDIETAEQRLSETPGAVGVFSSDHYETGRGSYLEDFLPYAPGVFVQSAQGSEDSKISIRGSDAHDDDIIGLSILLDGVSLNQGDGEVVLQDFDLHAVKYAEAYRGADALRFGSITLGGAINFVTLTGREAPPLETWFTVGSYDLFEEGFLSSYSKGPFDALLTVTIHNTDGYREHSRENYQKLFLSLGYKINESAENRLYLFMGHFSQQNPSSLTKDEMMSNPRQSDPLSSMQNWSTQWEYIRLVDRFLVKGDDWQLQLSGFYNHRDDTERDEFDDDSPDGNTHYYSDDFGGDAMYESTKELFGQRNRFTIGINTGFEYEPDTSFENNNGQNGAVTASDRTSTVNLAIYAENQHYFTKSFSVLTGFQAAYAQRRYIDTFNSPADGNQSNNEDYLAFNPKLGAMYEWGQRCAAYLNFSRSFQPPSFDQSQSTADDGDRLFNRLQSQTAWTIEAGTRGKSGPVSWDFAIYHSRVKNELMDLTNGEGQPLGTLNVPKTIHQGIEAGVEVQLAHGLLSHGSTSEDDNLTLEQTYTLSDFRFDNDSNYGNDRIAGTPVHSYKAELRYEHPSGFYCGPNIEWNISKYPVDEANTLFADPYALLGFRMGYKSKKGLEIFFEAKNLTNKIYAATVEPIGDARVEDTDSFNPGNGRSFYGGVSWKW